MNRQRADRIAARLAALAVPGAAPGQVAAAMAALAGSAERTLVPVLGPRGVAALFGRAVYLAARAHPWLIDPPAAVDARALGLALARQTDADAAAAGLLWLTTLDALLTGLIGPALTDRLLQPVWAELPTGAPLQELPP